MRTRENSLYKTTKCLPYYLILLIIFCILPQNVVESQVPGFFTDGIKALEDTSLWSETLNGLYKLTDLYVGFISKKKFGPAVLKEFGIDTENITISQLSVNLPDLSNSIKLQATVLKVAQETSSYLIHFIIGLVLFISFLLCTFLICCCRSAGCFCGKTGKKKKKSSDKTIIVILFLLLLIVTVVFFLDGFSVAVGASVFSDSFAKTNNSENTLVVQNIITLVEKSVEYLEDLKSDAKGVLNRTEILERVDKMILQLSGSILSGVLQTCTPCGDFNSSLSILTTSLNKLKSELDQSIILITSLNSLYLQLVSATNALKTKGTSAVAGCNTCGPAKTTYSQLILARNPTLLPDLSSFQSSLNIFTDGAIGQALLEGPDVFLKEITTKLGNATGFLNQTLNSFEEVLNADLPFALQNLNGASIFQSYNGYINQASPYLKIIVPILASTIFIIVAMNLLGLLLVVCCASKKPSIPEKVFIASSGSSFLTASIYALLAAILFVVTCPLYGEFCMDFYNGPTSNYFRIVDNIAREALKEEFNKAELLKGLNVNFNYSKLNVIRDGIFGYCESNQSLFNVLFNFANIDKNFTDSTITKYVKPLIENALPNNITLDGIFSTQTFQSINSTIDQMNQPGLLILTTLPIFPPIVTIPSLDQMKVVTQSSLTQLGAIHNDLNVILSTDIPVMEVLKAQVLVNESALASVAADLTLTLLGPPSIANQLRNLTANLILLKDSIGGSNGIISKIKNQAVVSIKDEMYNLFLVYKNKFLATFQCRKAYDLLNDAIAVPCKSIIRPLNALWLSLGSFSVLVIPSVVCGLWMGGLLVRQKKKPNNEFSDVEEMEEMKENYGNFRNTTSANTPLPALPPQYQPPYRLPRQPPPTTVFPNGVYVGMPKFQASNAYSGNNARLVRQPYNKVAPSNGNINNRGISPSFLPPYDPFTNYQVRPF